MAISKKVRKQMQSYSEFYQAVWNACARIPAGKIQTYKGIAAEIGRPRAARAVGQALGANPFAPAIPCHRVVREDGTLGGYSGSGGVALKRKLLEAEGVQFVHGRVLWRRPRKPNPSA